MKTLYFCFLSLLLFTCCNSKLDKAEETIVKNKWKLVSIEGTKSACFSEGEDFTISFEKELKHVFGYGACNKYYGKYEFIGDTSVEIKLDMTTSQTFDCDNIVWETPFFEALNGLSDYKLEDKQLTFYRDEKEILVFDIYIPESSSVEAAEIKKEPKPKPEKIKPDDYYGTFKGMLPCADCPGIDVTIVLNPDHTFNETREYIDRNSRFVQDGTYSIRNNILILKSTDTEEYYLLENNTIRKLNQNRKPIIGPTADSYIFKKVN